MRALADVVSEGDFTVPPYPAVALRLQRLLVRDRYSVDDVAQLIAADAALATTVLAAANSALFGVGAPVTTLAHAVNRLGARTVGAIAIASGVGAVAVASGVLLEVKFRAWRRTMSCALACQKLARARGVAPEEAFLSGLLHGFGRSIAIASMEQLLKIQPMTSPLSADEWLGIAEEQRSALASAVARAWQLPAVIAEAIDAKQRGASALNDLVLDADAIAGDVEAGRAPTAHTPSEAWLLEEFVASLPATLEAFASPASGPCERQNASAVLARSEPALGAEFRAANLAIIDRRAKAASTITCVSLASASVVIDSSKPFQPCAVVRLTVAGDGADFEPWFTVVHCSPRASRYRVELQLFSPTSEVRDRWQNLYAAAAGSSGVVEKATCSDDAAKASRTASSALQGR